VGELGNIGLAGFVRLFERAQFMDADNPAGQITVIGFFTNGLNMSGLPFQRPYKS
jgi:hypothetical protein